MKKLVEEFDIKKDITSYQSDYNTFANKDILDELRVKIIENLIEHNNPSIPIKQQVKSEVQSAIEGYNLSNIEVNYLYNLINNEINGYGPLTELLEDPAVTEIMVNKKDDIYIEIDGKIIKDDSISFINDSHIVRTIQRIIQPLGRTIDISHPMVDARLPDGSRLNAIIPPLSLTGPILTIRKFRAEIANVDDILRNGTVTPYMARFLEAAVAAKLNIIICGGTGSGKTTLLNVLSNFISNHDRIITIEDAAELKLGQEHVISLETRMKNYEGSGEITIKDLVINSLRMRPDRIVVGEVRGPEAFDMMQAMNTGHDGGMTTMHANSPEDALNRLEAMILMAGMEIPIDAIREYIASAIHLVINVERLSDGRRKVTSISEIVGYNGKQIELKEIFAFNQTGVAENGEIIGEFVLYDYTPKVYKKIKKMGCDTIKDIFGGEKW